MDIFFCTHKVHVWLDLKPPSGLYDRYAEFVSLKYVKC